MRFKKKLNSATDEEVNWQRPSGKLKPLKMTVLNFNIETAS